MRRATVALAALGFALTGCGTVSNLTTQPQPAPGGSFYPKPTPLHLELYGGVRNDIAEMRWSANEPGTGQLVGLITCPILALDLPLSLIGDTLTLPITLTVQTQRLIDAINDYYFPPERAVPPSEPAPGGKPPQ